MLKNGLIYKEFSGIDPEVAHLYEHIFIIGFNNYLKQQNLLPSLKGWLGGRTFNDILFVDYGFYSQTYLDAFKSYSTKPIALTNKEINFALSCISCESKIKINIKNSKSLLNQLNKLQSTKFTEQEQSKKTKFIDEQILNPNHSPLELEEPKVSKYKEYNLAIVTKLNNIKESTAILRLYPMLQDIVEESISNVPHYNQSQSDITYNHEKSMAYVSLKIILDNSADISEITKTINNYFVTYNRAELYSFMPDYVDALLKVPTWKYLPLDYYEATGILTSNKLIADSLLDKIIVSNILNNTEVIFISPKSA
jgi:hypothetical protein